MQAQRRSSRKREALREELLGARDHPGAEELYARLRPRFPDLSLGTVYRNLALFREEGSVVCVATVNGQERFDGRTEPHAHFICERCGRVADVPVTVPPELLSVELPGRVQGCSLTFYGVCDHCG